MHCDDRPTLLLGIVSGAVGMLVFMWCQVPEVRARVSRWVESAGSQDDAVKAARIELARRKRSEAKV